MIHQSHAAGLLAGLRDGRMTTHFNPVFTVKVLLEPSQTVANCAVTKFCAVPILFDWERWKARDLLMEVFGPLWLIPQRRVNKLTKPLSESRMR
jgi:hypothetical protein